MIYAVLSLLCLDHKDETILWLVCKNYSFNTILLIVWLTRYSWGIVSHHKVELLSPSTSVQMQRQSLTKSIFFSEYFDFHILLAQSFSLNILILKYYWHNTEYFGTLTPLVDNGRNPLTIIITIRRDGVTTRVFSSRN